uniref:Zinc finger protein CONSTANS-LIKE 9 n=1 Tax=Anthurium amnicola TaxID=1678845 RepID=A0A1D1Z5S9_9ARAE
MGLFCDFCGEQRPMVYCTPDAACLCLSCDRNVHSANALSRRHSRTLLCDGCNSQPATVRCIEETMSLCHNCDWNGHAGAVSASGHKRQTINCYSGCPSASELSRIWPFLLEITLIEDSEQGLRLMSIDENSSNDFCGPPGNSNTLEIAASSIIDDLANVDKANCWVGSSSMPVMDTVPSSGDQPPGSVDSTGPKLSTMGTDSLGICENDGLYEDFSMDNVDLNFDNYEELFGTSRNHSDNLFDDAEIDSMFEMKNPSATNDDCQEGIFTEAAPAGQVKAQPECSNAVSAVSMMSNPGNKSPKMCFPARRAHSNLSLSFSALSGESSAGDYQDCGMSPMLLMGEPPWYPPGHGNSTFTAASRETAVTRYKEKKKARKFEKKIRYESRKARADVRRRVKGRFVKAGDAYDYDPLCQARSC